MSGYAVNNKRIAKNTFFLYVRMLLTMCISIYTSRVVLATLGETDFGIYNVVGGFVAMFELLGASMTSASQRFLSFELGQREKGDVSKVFSTSLIIHLFIAIVVVVIAESVGVWFVNNKMNFPTDRYFAANWVFQLSLVAFLIKVISIPYNAVIIAFERMKAFAYVSLIEVSLKLLIVYLLVLSPIDELIFYAFLISLVSICIRLIYSWYVKKYIPDCKATWRSDKKLQKEMLSFAGWNMFGAAAGVANGQGINIILNLFFGATINAARGVTVQVQNAITGFVSNFQLAMSPQIIKSYASGNIEEMYTLLFRASRFSFFLMMFLSIPVFFEAPVILNTWLVEVPAHSVNFLRIVLLTGMSEAISQPLSFAMHACGKVKKYQIVVGTTSMMALPIAYITLQLVTKPESAFVVVLAFVFITMVTKLIMLKGMVGLPISKFFRDVFLRSIIVFLLAVIIPYLVSITCTKVIVEFFSVCITSVIFSSLSILFLGMSRHEREVLYKTLLNFYTSKVCKHIKN